MLKINELDKKYNISLKDKLKYKKEVNSLKISNLFKQKENKLDINDVPKPNPTHAIKGVSMQFEKGRVTGLIGYNGAGKSTTFNAIVNFLEEYNGNITLNGKPINSKDRIKLSYLSFGGDTFNNATISEEMKYALTNYGIPKKEIPGKIKELAKEFEFAFPMKTTIKSLSKGNRQKVALAQVFANPHAEFFLLDEPFDGLDPLMVDRISAAIEKRVNKNIGIIITSHRLNVIDDMCDEFYVLKKGELVARKSDLNSKQIVIDINIGVDIKKIKGKFIDEVIETKKNVFVKLNDINNFPKLTEILLKDSKFKSIKIQERSLSKIVFNEYGGENEE